MIRTKLAAAAIAATALLGLGACSSGVKIASPSTTAKSSGGDTGNTTATGATTGVPNLSGDCAKLAQQWAAAIGAASTGSSADDAKNVFDNLQKIVPDNLKDAAKTLADAYGKYFEVMSKYKDDPTKAMSDPKVVEELQAIASPDVQAASEKISTYFSSQCK